MLCADCPRDVAIIDCGQSFSRRSRLTRTDEYSSVFDFRRVVRGEVFMLHYLPRPGESTGARLGLVVGKRLIKSAVDRNLIKRLARERFRCRRDGLGACDVVLRLLARPEGMNRNKISAEIDLLLDRLESRRKRVTKDEERW